MSFRSSHEGTKICAACLFFFCVCVGVFRSMLQLWKGIEEVNRSISKQGIYSSFINLEIGHLNSSSSVTISILQFQCKRVSNNMWACKPLLPDAKGNSGSARCWRFVYSIIFWKECRFQKRAAYDIKLYTLALVTRVLSTI